VGACVCADDGRHPALACGSSGGKLFLHTPHTREEGSEGGLRFLRVNQKVAALASGAFAPGEADVLLVGTPTSLLVYDAERNADVFHRDVPDGVSATLLARLPSQPSPVAVVGGNCSLQGFARDGSEAFWTVTGDVVTALALVDAAGPTPDLLVGSADYAIRAYAGEDVAAELTETDVVSALAPAPGQRGRFAYALANGTLGAYVGTSRAWRVKAGAAVAALTAFDLDADGALEVVAGWGNGRLEARRADTGALVYRETLPAAIAGVVRGDYRMDGREEVIAVSVDGEVRGYLPVEAEAAAAAAAAAGGAVAASGVAKSVRGLSRRGEAG
jgi:Bardet-Biedl syndrome 2 protein